MDSDGPENPGPEDTPDEALVQRFQDGDQTAFDKLYLKYEKQLYYKILCIVHHPQDAEDIVQETFFKGYQELFTLRLERSFVGWLSTIASHKSIDHLRKVKNRGPSVSLEPDDEVITLENRDPSPEEVFIADERMREALQQLRPKYLCKALILDVLGCTHEEIAQELGVQVSCVSTYLSNARREFRQMFDIPARSGRRSGTKKPRRLSKKDLLIQTATSTLVND